MQSNFNFKKVSISMLLVHTNIAISVPRHTELIPKIVNKKNFFLKKYYTIKATFTPMTIILTPILCFVTILTCKFIVSLAKSSDTVNITNQK